MKIIIGSLNPAKINAVISVFASDEVERYGANSHVSAQPMNDRETRLGAIHRAKESAQAFPQSIGIGLEGGITVDEGICYLINWGALVDEHGHIFVASGARIPLPEEVSKPVLEGEELGMVMDRYAKKKNVRKKEGAIGIFTNGVVDRSMMFQHVVQLLKGQYEYVNK
ncbi:DUF84 family protein [Bacillaceae bacterium S4-13-56]